MSEHQIEPLRVNSIVFATISDSLGAPIVNSLIDYPDYSADLKNPLELRGIDEVELRILEVDEDKKVIHTCFHASSILNPQVSTGRAILITYDSMRNTVSHIFRRLLST